MARISEISSGSSLAQRVVQIMLRVAPLIGLMEFYRHPGNSDNPRKTSGASGGQYRAQNSDYPDNEVDPAFASLILAILGDEVHTDQSHERRGFDIASVRASDLEAFAEDLAKFLVDEHVNGGGQGSSPPALNGLEGLLPMSNSQAIYAEDNSTVLTVQDGSSDTAVSARHQFKRLLHKLIEMVDGGPSALLMSNDMKAAITSWFESQIDRVESDFGTPIDTFNNVALVGVGYDKSGNSIIAQDEQPGNITTDSQSIYAVRYGERRDLACSTSNGVNVTDKGLVGSHYVYNCELDMQQGLLNDKAVGRLAGLELQ